ncbi:methyltransferase family protein [Thiomicrorhabdus sediminis]|uniref:Isoprenylcysteine carboxylmethyltransferase family protein n=1 Tax=Thiomicrorhabdus sediminis TaxID=2580412 RepID=A0A4P9K6F3_9GAMM|nr:isoprenylcysteine carboxylmethyltransferase family protein [Thiomicrorhabdus sediminis]QCU90040.1 isoprenylcysteine carboxylmethyltransferase family protein [Thiomicrorhabdus sediminis]
MAVKPIDKTSQSASIRQWSRLALVYLLIPLILFICAGDIDWWQAWIYTLLIVVVGMGGRILANRRHPGLTAERQDLEIIQSAKSWDKVLAPLMALSISYPMMIVAGLDHRFHWSAEFSLELNAVGFTLIAFGYVFSAWSLLVNRFFYSVVSVRTERGHKLCDSGPYRLVRHPGYAGNIVAVFGIVMALDSLWALIPAIVALFITVIRTGLEDRTLQQELPGYREYSQRVRYRLMPGIY